MPQVSPVTVAVVTNPTLRLLYPVTKLMKETGYGEGYEKYDTQSYLPEKLKGKKYYLKK